MLESGHVEAKTAYNKLIKDADKILKEAVMSVMEKTQMPPSGDKHDYVSLAPYWFPNPDTPDGLPYIRKDGQKNPEVFDFKDKDYIERMSKYVEILGLAYYFSGNEKYAQKATDFVRTWFINPATKMNPNLQYGQMIKGRNEGRGAGLIDTRNFISALEGVELIRNSKHWSDSDHKALQEWFDEFLDWMETSKNGREEMKAQNNHGVFYDAQRLAFALFIDNKEKTEEVVNSAKKRLDYQMNDEGAFPKELERTIGIHYSVFVLKAFVSIAEMSDKTDIDFWNYTTPSRKSLKKGMYFIAPYLAQEKEWAWKQINPFDYSQGEDLMYLSAKKFNEPLFEKTGEKIKTEKTNMRNFVITVETIKK